MLLNDQDYDPLFYAENFEAIKFSVKLSNDADIKGLDTIWARFETENTEEEPTYVIMHKGAVDPKDDTTTFTGHFPRDALLLVIGSVEIELMSERYHHPVICTTMFVQENGHKDQQALVQEPFRLDGKFIASEVNSDLVSAKTEYDKCSARVAELSETIEELEVQLFEQTV